MMARPPYPWPDGATECFHCDGTGFDHVPGGYIDKTADCPWCNGWGFVGGSS